MRVIWSIFIALKERGSDSIFEHNRSDLANEN